MCPQDAACPLVQYPEALPMSATPAVATPQPQSEPGPESQPELEQRIEGFPAASEPELQPLSQSSRKLSAKLKAHLREIFGRFGDIESLDLPMNKAFMTNRGTAYILYYDPADAEAAIAHMHEAQLDGAVLNVSIVLPRRAFSRSPPPPQGRRRSFGRPRHGRGPPLDGRPPRRSPPRSLCIRVAAKEEGKHAWGKPPKPPPAESQLQ
ncbi:RNA-binding-domain-containing protein [Aspergillus terreus]|uniref:RNA-binding-domain-containing protein n=1 Tax=Aspergillus terreus TaxID=33178 RepID=A0A5M3YZS0_ASPTE|nr:hypothetical protein ATETN484_0004087400 [Aspergillus terreus]GFF13942.1 RNA-binding-domain-containing protein [Aspergillus terreus]